MVSVYDLPIGHFSVANLQIFMETAKEKSIFLRSSLQAKRPKVERKTILILLHI